MKQIFTINKIQAAGCQLDTAIELLFQDKDQVSINVLIFGAWSIIKDLLIKSNKKSVRDHLAERQSEMTPTEVWHKLNLLWTFCKHAEDDPHGEMQFSSELCEIALFSAIDDFKQLHVTSEYMDAYYHWLIAKDIRFLEEEEELFSKASKLFPNIINLNIKEQKKLGYKAICEVTP